jgi:hypothetical protein
LSLLVTLFLLLLLSVVVDAGTVGVVRNFSWPDPFGLRASVGCYKWRHDVLSLSLTGVATKMERNGKDGTILDINISTIQ